MAVGRILTLGLGSFGGKKYLPTLGIGPVTVASTAPNEGWVATTLLRVVVGNDDRAVKASGITRVVWAGGQGR